MIGIPDDQSRRLAVIAQQEPQPILRSLGKVDAVLFYGRRLNVRWVSERARAAAAGMRRSGARISQEIPAVRTHEVAWVAAKAEECLGRLAESLSALIVIVSWLPLRPASQRWSPLPAGISRRS